MVSTVRNYLGLPLIIYFVAGTKYYKNLFSLVTIYPHFTQVVVQMFNNKYFFFCYREHYHNPNGMQQVSVLTSYKILSVDVGFFVINVFLSI